MALTLSGTDGIVGAGFTLDASGASVTAGVGTFSSLQGSGANLTALPAANLTGTLPALNAASLTKIPAANIVGVCTDGFSGGKRTISSSTTLSSQAAVDYTGFGILTRFEIHMNAVSCSGSGNLGVRLGTGGSVTTSGYLAQSSYVRGSDNVGESNTTEFETHGLGDAGYSSNGIWRFFRIDATQHKWYCEASLTEYNTSNHWFYVKGYVTLAGELDIIRVTVETGNFDSGNLRLVTYTD